MVTLKGKTAIVTGSSRGIGASIAKNIALEGANVVLTARSKDDLITVCDDINQYNKGKAVYVVADMTIRSEVEHVVKETENQFGQVDIYVNNAALMYNGSVRNGNMNEWEQMIDVNIKGVLYGIHTVLPQMLERSSGHIINLSSVSGFEVTKMSTVYSATKYAVRALSMGLEKELAKTGVKVTNISPGMVTTDPEVSEDRTRAKGERISLHTNDIAKAIIYALKQPEHVNVNEITVRPV